MNENIEVYDKKTSKPKGKIIVVITIIIIGLILIGSGILFLSQPKAIFQESYNYLTKALKSTQNNVKLMNLIEENDKVKYTGDINININEDLELGIENIDLKLELAEDKKEQITRYYLDSKIEEQNLLEIISYFKEDKMYMTISEIMDKYYYEESEYISFFESMDTTDIEVLADSVSSSIKKVMTNDKFEKSKTKTDIDGQEKDCTKLSLVVTEKLLSELGTQIINDLKANDEALDSLVNLTHENKEDLLKEMDSALEDLKETGDEVAFTYNVYYTGIDNIQKLEIESEEDVISYIATDNNYVIIAKEADKVVFELSITKEEDFYNIVLDTESMDITGKYTNTETTGELTLSLFDENSQALGTMIIKSTIKSDTASTTEIIISTDGTQIVKITMNSQFTFNEDVKSANLENAKAMDEMTEEEATTIMTNLANHPIIGPVMTLLETYMGSGSLEEDYTEYNY